MAAPGVVLKQRCLREMNSSRSCATRNSLTGGQGEGGGRRRESSEELGREAGQTDYGEYLQGERTRVPDTGMALHGAGRGERDAHLADVRFLQDYLPLRRKKKGVGGTMRGDIQARVLRAK